MGNWPTEPPSDAVALYMFYNIWFADPAEYEAAVATFGGVSVSRSPGFMRTALGISETANGWDGVDDTWIQFVQPPNTMLFNMDGSWQAPRPIKGSHSYVYPSDASGNPYWWPPDSYTFDYNQDWLEIPGHPSIPIWGAGPTLVWYWVGILLSKTGGVASSPTTITPPGESVIVRQAIRPRRFSTGWEAQSGGQVAPTTSPEGLLGQVPSEGYTRAASRTPDGIGYLSSSFGLNSSYNLNDNGTPSNPENSQERIYLKFQKFPTTATSFMTFTADSSNETMNMTIDQNGQLNAYTINNFIQNSGPLGAGATLALGVWYRFDPYVYFFTRPNPSGGANCTLIVKIKGTEVLNVTGSVNIGFGPQVRVHASSTVGSGGNGLEICYDDWENIDPGPQAGGNLQEATIDYWTGVHMQLIKNTAFNENTNWTGDFLRSMQKQPANPLGLIASSTSGARLALDTDMDANTIDSRLNFVRQQGTIALLAVAAISKGVASTTDKLGAKHSGGDETRTLSMGTTLQGYHYLMNVSAGLLDPKPIASLEPCRPLLIKSTDGNLTSVAFLSLEATFMGQYGAEDSLDPDFPVITDAIGQHNAPFWATYMGRGTVPPPNTVGVAAGTYVGNGTFQTITIQLPGIHWLMIRNTATFEQTWWASTHLGPHLQVTDDAIRPGLLIDVDINSDGDTELRISNNSTASNSNGVTYQYVAFSDVMSRCLLNIPVKQAAAGGGVTALFDGGFTPEFSMAQGESVKNNSAATQYWTKGPGMTADQAKQASNSNPVATGMRFGTGNITELASIAGASFGQSISLWRQYADNVTTDPNILFIDRYTGNGAGARTVSVNLNGRRPLFAIVIPLDNSSPFMRDPGHTGSNSSTLGSANNLTSGITGGGIDQLIVASGLNTNLVVYAVFIIPSCTTDAGNNGWGVNGVCGLAEPGWDANNTPDWLLDPPPIPADIAVLGSGGIVLSGETAKLLVEQMSGIYTLIVGKTNDTIITGSSPAEEDVEIPDPHFKTGYIGG
jgi:hypothetical protein